MIVSVQPDLASEAERTRALEKVRGVFGFDACFQRTALELAFFEGLTHTEIAGKTG